MNDDQNQDLEEASIEQNQEEASKISLLKHYSSHFTNNALWTNLLLAGLFANSIYLFYHDYEVSHRFSSLLMMVQMCCVVLFFVIRVAPSKVSAKPSDWAAAIIGTCLSLLISPVNSENEIVILMLLQFFGIFISITALISLNNSFGIVPALRNIKTKGLYSLIRHPIYFGYFLSITCIALQNFSLLNIALVFTIITADIFRIIAEERLLSESLEYHLYKERVKWRVLPFIW